MAFSLLLWIAPLIERMNKHSICLKSHLTSMTKINWGFALIWLAECYFAAPGRGSFQWNFFRVFRETGVAVEKTKRLLPFQENNEYSCPLGLIPFAANGSSWFSEVCTSQESFKVTTTGLLWSVSLLSEDKLQFLFFFLQRFGKILLFHPQICSLLPGSYLHNRHYTECVF